MRQAIVVAALVRRDGKILLARRSEGKATAPGLYHLPGGHVEYGEQPSEALRRELREELGVDSSVGAPFAAFAYMADGGVHTVAILFHTSVSGEPELQGPENMEFAWTAPEDCASYFDAGDPVFQAVEALGL